jgi:DNA repair protein REV1
MVKPPKTMQPEGISSDTTKKNRDMDGDSFRHYMARKIELQRLQFGIQQHLPPPVPPPQLELVESPSRRGKQVRLSTGNDSSTIVTMLHRLKRKHCSGKKRKRQKTSQDLVTEKEIKSPDLVSKNTGVFTTTNSTTTSTTADTKVLHSQNRRPDLIFRNIVVLINGYTQPDNETLQRLLHRYGGDVEKYETNRVTHILAQTLSHAKIKIYQQQRKPLPVVQPQWIVDCVQQQRLLPHGPYLVSRPLLSVQQYLDRAAAVPPQTERQSPSEKDPLTQVPPSSPLKTTTTTSTTITEKLELQPCTDTKYLNGKLRTTGTDPDFLTSFFHQSRLSFIGSFQQRASSLKAPTKTIQNTNNVTTDSKAPQSQRLVFHVDMDCFFANVVLRHYPHYRNKPVVISHAGTTNTTTTTTSATTAAFSSSSECATCNYEARSYGISKGMFLGTAKQLCPHLVVLHYDFEGYEEVSDQVAEILHRHAGQYPHSVVEQVSCDEFYLELHLDQTKGLQYTQAEEIAQAIRHEIVQTTECTATIGVGANKLLAKLGTDKVKPDGCHVVKEFHDLLEPLQLRELHGIGYRSEKKLKAAGLVTVKDVWDLGSHAESELCRILGTAVGKKIFNHCRGQDDRPVSSQVSRKTIGAECNYGVRFDGPYGVDYMMQGLAKEVEKRMVTVGVCGSKVTLKVKQRKADAPPPPKFLGHGSCHNLSKSLDLPGGTTTNDAAVFSNTGMQLFQELAVPIDDIRGMGLVISKLSPGEGKDGMSGGDNSKLTSWLQTGIQDRKLSPKPSPSFQDDTEEVIVEKDEARDDAIPDDTASPDRHRDNDDDDLELPPPSQIRMSQVEALPSPLQRRIAARLGAERQTQEEQNVFKQSMTDEASHDSDDLHWRQTSVKQLFRLAEVKSGKDRLVEELGESVSLTQLNCLPLEMQLEVVNKGKPDYPALSSRSQQRKSAHRAPSSIRSVPTKRSKTRKSESDLVAPSPMKPIRDEGDDEELDEPGVEPSTDSFFKDDVLPLQSYLSQHNPTPESMAHVSSFLCTCVKEGRWTRSVQLLRSISRRRDEWSRDAYLHVLNQVDDYLCRETGCRLDRAWLYL